MNCLNLSHLKPRFKGSVRAVYIHPDDPSLLVKVPHEGLHERIKAVPEWKKRFKPLGANAANMHELRETMRWRPMAGERLAHLFMAKAMVETDLGWGLIVDAEFDKDGNYAQVFANLAKQSELYQEALDAFLLWSHKTDAVFYDLNPWNIVLAWRNERYEAVVIDGIGDKSAIPFRTYFPSLNKKKNQQVIERFLRYMERLKNEA